jgi:hypothetical protein
MGAERSARKKPAESSDRVLRPTRGVGCLTTEQAGDQSSFPSPPQRNQWGVSGAGGKLEEQMSSRRSGALLATCLGILLSACSERLIDFTIISSKNVDLTRASSFKRSDTRVDGSDSAYLILFIPTGVPHVKDAVDRAIEKVPGAVALVDGVVRVQWWTAVLFGSRSIVVEGTPLIDRGTAELPQSRYMASYVDPDTQETKLVYLQQDEYAQMKDALDRDDPATAERILLAAR